MNPDRFLRLRALVLEVADLSEEERRAHLEVACRGDPELRKEVEELLAHDRETGNEPNPHLLIARALEAIPPPTRWIGQTISHYQILELLGEGGMGQVFRARDTRLDRAVAFKIISPLLSADTERIRRFEQEARAAGSLNHPNIVAIYDIGAHESVPFEVMELLDGESLRQRLKHGPIPIRKAIDYAAQCARGLAAAHAKGVIHRDIKPENLFVTKDGRIKILDFGVAKLVRTDVVAAPEGARSEDSLTGAGAIIGTSGYMSPEQAQGHSADARSDIFALGATLYEMLTGRRTFQKGSFIETLHAIVSEDPAPMSASGREIPTGIEEIARHCLEKNPEERFQSARDLAFDLESSGLSQRSPPSAGLLGKPSDRRIARAMAGLAALIVLAFFASALLGEPPGTSPPEFQRLTFRLGTIDNARFTPDGQTIVYDARWEGQPSEIFTLRPGNPESRPLGISNARLLGISSKGELAVQLQPYVFAGRFTGTLARVPLGGGVPREVRDEIYEADWLGEGSQLALAPSDSPSHGAPYYIQGPTKVIARSPREPLLPMRTSLDGKGVAFWRQGPGKRGGELALARAGSAERTLDHIGYACTGLAWNSRTREIWYTELDTLGSTHLNAVSMSGRHRILLSLPGNAVLHDIRADGAVLLSMHSSRWVTRVLAPGMADEHDLAWLDCSWPIDLSSDGRLLTMEEEGVAGGRTGLMCVRSTDGSPARRIGEGRVPRLSPDGQWVVALQPGDRARIRVMPVGAGEARDLATGDVIPEETTPWYFPDGRRFLIYGRQGVGLTQFFTIPVEGGTPQPVTPAGWSYWNGERVVSPDGLWIVCLNPDNVNTIVPVGGGARRAVPGVEHGEVVLGWTEDSRSLYVFRRGEVPARIDRVDVVTGRRTLWKELGPADRTGVSLVHYALITPDGRWYAYIFERSQTVLYLVRGLR